MGLPSSELKTVLNVQMTPALYKAERTSVATRIEDN